MRLSRFPIIPKLLKNSFRNCSVNAEIKPGEQNDQINEEKTDKTHIYMKKLTKSETVKYLADSIVYNKDGVIVTNKPFGVGKVKLTKKIENYIPQTFNEVTLEEVLPDLATMLGLDSLRHVKSPEKLASGVTILAATDEAFEKTSDGLHVHKVAKKIPETYLTVCVGCPVEKEVNTMIGIKLMENDKNVAPSVIEKWSNSQLKKKQVKRINWVHKVLSFSEFAALIQVQLSSTRKNSLKMCLATKYLSPVLGDLLYSSRVQDLLGVSLLKDPSVCIVGEPPKLDPKILSALQINQEQVKIIPNMVHLSSVEFLDSKKNVTVVSVPPPEHFIWTCQQLGLVTDEISTNETKI